MTPLSSADHLALGTALAQASAPPDLYRAVESLLAQRLGFRLFTAMVLTPDGQQVRRVYSTDPKAYPLAGLKQMGPTPWGDLVLRRHECFVGRDAAAIRWAFPDHELSASLGLGSVINVPVLAFGQVLGTMNLLDAEGRYGDADLPLAREVAPYLVAPFLRELAPRAA